MRNWVYRYFAIRSKSVKVGKNVHIGPLSRIWAASNLQLGHDVYIGKHATIEVDGVIGSGTVIANSVGIVGRTDHDMREVGRGIRHSSWVGNVSRLAAPVEIGLDVWIGFGAIILGPVKIGNCAVIAAGAVVIDEVEAFQIVAGNPAKGIGYRFESEQDQASHLVMLKKLYEDSSS